jgi:putative oxidoreductase
VRLRLLDPGGSGPLASAGLLFARLTVGVLLPYLHGYAKLQGFDERVATFADPLGIGSRWSLVGAIGGELVFPVLVAAGLLTRLSAIPPAFTMAVIAFVVHADDPWKRKELALVYLACFVLLMFTGAGRYSLDAFLSAGRKPRPAK